MKLKEGGGVSDSFERQMRSGRAARDVGYSLHSRSSSLVVPPYSEIRDSLLTDTLLRGGVATTLLNYFSNALLISPTPRSTA